MKKKSPDNIILAHKGALGDFLLAWPSFLSIRTCFRQAEIFWHGRDAFLPWLRPLGIRKVPPRTAAALDRLYSHATWPEPLKESTVFWFGLNRVTVSCTHPQLFFLTAVDPDGKKHVRKNYLGQLQELQISFNEKWQKTWQDMFARQDKQDLALIFPGSGSPAKNWPVENFLWAGKRFQCSGLKPLLVLGPAEEKISISGSKMEQIRCRSLEDLQNLIQKSRVLLGNDSGPMHLGAMFNKPGLVLFGPTPPAIWRPQGMRVLKSPAQCAPCSQTARIQCQEPTCMQAITRKKVQAWMNKILNRQSAGL